MIKTYDTIPSLPIGERSRREGIRTFRRDGFVILRDVVPDAILASLERVVESNMSSPSSWSNDYVSNNDDDDRRTVRQFAIDCRLPDENATSAFLHEHVLVKEGPGTTVMSTPWHQDEPFSALTPKSMAAYGCLSILQSRTSSPYALWREVT